MKNAAVNLLRMTKTSARWSFNWAEWSPTENDYRRAVSCVQLDEKERLGRFVYRKDARASLVGRLMMRKFVSEYCDIPYDRVVFARDANNKPILDDRTKNISFNVSHQGNFTVLAGESRDVNLGVDVMKLEYTGGKTLSEFFRIMNRNFSISEWSEIRGVDGTAESVQTAMFCRHWALKESYVKAIGIGIVVDLRKLDFHTNSPLSLNETVTDTTLYLDGAKQNWLFEESMIDPEHCVAVAIEKNQTNPESPVMRFERLDFHDLMANAVPLHPEDARYADNYFGKQERP